MQICECFNVTEECGCAPSCECGCNAITVSSRNRRNPLRPVWSESNDSDGWEEESEEDDFDFGDSEEGFGTRIDMAGVQTCPVNVTHGVLYKNDDGSWQECKTCKAIKAHKDRFGTGLRRNSCSMESRRRRNPDSFEDVINHSYRADRFNPDEDSSDLDGLVDLGKESSDEDLYGDPFGDALNEEDVMDVEDWEEDGVDFGEEEEEADPELDLDEDPFDDDLNSAPRESDLDSALPVLRNPSPTWASAFLNAIRKVRAVAKTARRDGRVRVANKAAKINSQAMSVLHCLNNEKCLNAKIIRDLLKLSKGITKFAESV